MAMKILSIKIRKSIMDSGIQGAELDAALNKIDREMAGYARRSGSNGTIPIHILHDAKVDKYSNINFMTDASKQKYEKTVAKALKELVEDHTKSVDVKKINKELSKHFAVMDYLEKLDGRVVEGGKLGKYFASMIGTGVGGAVGAAAGPYGAAVGAAVGAEAGARVKGNIMSRVFNGKTGRVAPQADVINDAIKYKNKPPLQLNSGHSTSSSPNNRGSLNASQRPTATTAKSSNISSNLPQNQNNDVKLNAITPIGATAGVEKDDDGKWKFNSQKAALGILGVAASTKLSANSPQLLEKAKKLHSEDYSRLIEFLDYVRLRGKENVQLEIDARRLAEHYKINPEQSNSKLANKLAMIVDAFDYLFKPRFAKKAVKNKPTTLRDKIGRYMGSKSNKN
jgi:hypothetical protein